MDPISIIVGALVAGAAVRELIQREFDMEYSPAQVIRILRVRLGMHFSKPLPRDYRRPPDAEERLKAALHQVVNLWC